MMLAWFLATESVASADADIEFTDVETARRMLGAFDHLPSADKVLCTCACVCVWVYVRGARGQSGDADIWMGEWVGGQAGGWVGW